MLWKGTLQIPRHLHLSQPGFIYIVFLDTLSLMANRALKNVKSWLIPKGHGLHKVVIFLSQFLTTFPSPFL